MRLGREELTAPASGTGTATGRGRALDVYSRASRTSSPPRFTPAFVVQALGVDDDVEAVTSWVRQVSLDPFVRTEVLPGQVVVVNEHASGSRRQTSIQPGEVLVQQPGSRFGWDVYSAPSFNTAYTHRPRELPIFDDGEVAS